MILKKIYNELVWIRRELQDIRAIMESKVTIDNEEVARTIQKVTRDENRRKGCLP